MFYIEFFCVVTGLLQSIVCEDRDSCVRFDLEIVTRSGDSDSFGEEIVTQ